MARCCRCNSFRAVGYVKTGSPESRDKWVEDPEDPRGGRWTFQGQRFERPVCMACILKLEAWLDGKDRREPGQLPLS